MGWGCGRVLSGVDGDLRMMISGDGRKITSGVLGLFCLLVFFSASV